MKRSSAKRRGAILPLVAVTTVALLGVIGLALDTGIIQRRKGIAQMAADAGAKAGAIEILRSQPDSSVRASARGETSRNGFQSGVGGIWVVVTHPTTSGNFIGSNFVNVLVQDTVRTLFGGILGRSVVVINARSTGGVTGTTQSCIAALDPSRPKPSLFVQSGAIVRAVGCNVVVNNSDAQALCVTGTGYLSADAVSITGGYDPAKCTGPIENSSGGSLTPATGAPPAVDPLASYASLQVSDTSAACAPGTDGKKGTTISSSTTLNPGVYCGGISISKATTTVTFNPGLYVIKGGGLEASAGATLIGSEVTFVTLKGPGIGGEAFFKPVNLASDTKINLSAMTTGGLAGILFYSPVLQGPLGQLQLNKVHSGANATITGSFYFPDQELYFGSGGALTINGGLVAKAIDFASDVRINVTGFAGGLPYSPRQASIVE